MRATVLDCLLSGTRQVIGKHPRGCTVAAGVVPGSMPKHNSEPIAAGGSTGFDATLSRLGELRGAPTHGPRMRFHFRTGFTSAWPFLSD